MGLGEELPGGVGRQIERLVPHDKLFRAEMSGERLNDDGEGVGRMHELGLVEAEM